MLMSKYKLLRQICGVAETFNLLSLKLLYKRKDRKEKLALFPGLIFREYMSLVGEDRWNSKSLFDIFPDATGVRIIVEHLPGYGISASIEELASMAFITQALRPKKIFEIGTFRGRTALNFALNSPGDCEVFTLDLPPDARAGFVTNKADAQIIERSITGVDYEGRSAAKKIKQLYGDSLKFDFSGYEGDMDIVFVDGAHHYDVVRSDTLNALKMLRPGGFVIWHDFANYGDYNDVTRAVLDLLPAKRVIQIGSTELALYRDE